jgi:hypothetical protein
MAYNFPKRQAAAGKFQFFIELLLGNGIVIDFVSTSRKIDLPATFIPRAVLQFSSVFIFCRPMKDFGILLQVAGI